MTRSILLAAAAAAALGLAACDRPAPPQQKEKPKEVAGQAPYKTISRLDCPAVQGELKLGAAAPDGRSCAYTGADGATVTLQLINGGEAALTPIETELRGLIPPLPPRSAKSTVDVAASRGKDGKDGDAHVRLPGLSIDAQGGRAQISIGGLRIDAEGENTDLSMNKRGGDVKITADGDGAEIRDSRSNVRGLRRTLILARNKPTAAGYRLVGYEARGPQAGPLVVGVVRAKGDGDADYVFKDVRALVTRNVGR